MTIDKRTYIRRAKGYSEELVKHVLKLYLFKDEYDVDGWLETVSKGLKDLETVKLSGFKDKPQIKYLEEVLDNDNKIDLNTLDAKIDVVKYDQKYKRLPKKSDDKISVSELANILLDLINRLNPTKVYTRSEINEIVEDWYETKVRWY